MNDSMEPGGMPGTLFPLRRGFLRLRFPEPLEREFSASPHELRRRRAHTVSLLVFCAVLFLGCATLPKVWAIAPAVAVCQTLILIAIGMLGVLGYLALERATREAFIDRKRLTEVAMHDGLTGLLNRAALEAQVRQLWQQAARDHLPISVVLVDIDHFKAYNDCYGHQAGDQCLREVAGALRRVAHRRPLDLVARYGGEELIAVLFGADRSHAENVARQMREAVVELAIPHAASTTRPQVTVSVGAATLEPAVDVAYDHAVQLADRALYEAKNRGRDGWVFYDRTHLHSDGLFESGDLFQAEEDGVKLAS